MKCTLSFDQNMYSSKLPHSVPGSYKLQYELCTIPAFLLPLFLLPLPPPPLPEKNQRLKEAKEEAGKEIEQYRRDRETQFQEKKKNYDGSKDDFKQRMEEEKNEKLAKIQLDIAGNKGMVIDSLLEKVYDIQPELHKNKRLD